MSKLPQEKDFLKKPTHRTIKLNERFQEVNVKEVVANARELLKKMEITEFEANEERKEESDEHSDIEENIGTYLPNVIYTKSQYLSLFYGGKLKKIYDEKKYTIFEGFDGDLLIEKVG